MKANGRKGGRVVQLTDTHIVARGQRSFGCDTAAYLADAVRATNALQPDYVLVTGDLTNNGEPAEYAHFRDVMRGLEAPYFAIPGNHDDPVTLRAELGAAHAPDSGGAKLRYSVDGYAIRTIALDVTRAHNNPGAELDEATFAWLELTLASAPSTATVIAVHQPPFRTGLWFLDAFGFRGARRLKALVERSPHVGRVICGHVHCVRMAQWGRALAASAPSTAPQRVPEIFESRRIAAIRRERAGFAVHDWTPGEGMATTVYRRDDAGAYRPAES